MTPTHDTAAALWSAIDAYGCDAASHGALGKDATTRAAIDRAITAHVEAEVARRLAAAPDVEVAIGSVTCRRCDHDDPLGDSVSDALRAAIAADKARAVESARPTPDEARRLVEAFEQVCDMWQYREAAARTTARDALIAALVGKDP